MNPQQLFSLDGRAALISGACSGIGLHMARTFAQAGAKAGKSVRVNALCPGSLETVTHAQFEEKGFAEAIRKKTPMRSFGQARQLDGAALLLATDAGSCITGVAMPVDGGQVLTWM